MAIPVKEKTWVYDYANHQILNDSGETLSDNTLLYIKNTMVSLGWTVRGSSDGTTANTSDNWTDDTDLVHSSGAHSWIVLRNSTLDIEICFDLNTVTTNVIDVWAARTAYNLASPVTTAKPTSTNEWEIGNSWNVLYSTACVRSIVHILATDESPAENTLIMVYTTTLDYYDAKCSYLMLYKPEDAPSGWTTPAAAMVGDSVEEGPTTVHFSSDTANHMFVGTNKYNFYCTGECANGALLPVQYDGYPVDLDTDGGKIIGAIGLFSTDTGARGSNGRLPDTYWAPAHDAHGALYSDTTKSWVKLGAFLLPWDGESITKTV